MTKRKISKSDEEIEDIVGAMAGYGLEYDDAQGLISSTRQGPNPYDAAQTFTESAVTLGRSLTEVRNGSIGLSNGGRMGPSGAGSGDSQTSTPTGFRLTPEVDIAPGKWSVYSEAYNPDNGLEIEVSRVSDGAVLGTQSIAASAGWVAIEVGLTDGEQVDITVKDTGGSTFFVGHVGGSFPQSIAQATADQHVGFDNGGSWSGEWVGLSAFEAPPAGTGSVTIDWLRPADIYAWDVATFTATEDGETVDVYVAYDDGSGWTRTNGGSPITRNYSLGGDSNISPSDSVRIEAELSRSDTSNNPTLDSAYRSWRV